MKKIAKKGTKLTVYLLVLMMLFTIAPVSALADENVQVVTLDANGGYFQCDIDAMPEDSITMTMEKGTSFPDDYEHDGYRYVLENPGMVLIGWATTKEKADALEPDVISYETIVDGLSKVYASWSTREYASVTFDANGGYIENQDDGHISDTETRAVKIGRSFQNPYMTLYPGDETLVFDGWYDASEGGNRYDENIIIKDDMTLYAHWTTSPDVIRVESVVVNGGVTVFEQNANTNYDSIYNEETDEWMEVEYPQYDVSNPGEITVTTTDGEEYTGFPWEVAEQIEEHTGYYLNYSVSSGQSYENQWQPGNTYQVTFTFGGKTTTFPVEVEASPVKSVNVKDVTLYEGSGYTRFAEIYDEETDEWTEVEYPYYYDIGPREITVITKDGEEYTGYPGQVASQIREKTGQYPNQSAESDQSYENQWLPGNTYQATFTFGGIKVPYQVAVKASPVESVTVETVVRYEGECSLRTHGYDDEETGEWIKITYQEYDIEPSVVTVVADGKTYSGTPQKVRRAISKAIGYNAAFDWSSDQSVQNTWGAGVHEATLEYGGRTYKYNVEITESPIASVEVDDVNLSEGIDAYLISESDIDADSGQYESVCWNRYLCKPESVTVTMNDGKIYRGSVYSAAHWVESNYPDITVPFSWSDDQDSTSPWTAGTHTATLMFGGKTVAYNVLIGENPIASVHVEPLTAFVGSGSMCEDWDIKTDEEFSWEYYSIVPQNMTVTMKDGTEYTGSLDQIDEEIGRPLGKILAEYDGESYFRRESDQSGGHPWKVGKHNATLYFGGQTIEYDVNIEEAPVQILSVKAEDVEKHEFFDASSYYAYVYDPESDEEVETEWYHYNALPASITLETDKGSFSGTPYEVYSLLWEQYGLIYEYEALDTQSYDDQWKKGNTYPATFVFGPVQTSYHVTIADNLIKTVSAEPVTICEGSGFEETSWDGNSGKIYKWTHYDLEPSEIRVEMTDGTVFTGRLSNVLNQIDEAYGKWLEYRVSDDQSYQNIWKPGEHTATLRLGGAAADFAVELVSNPIISVAAKDVEKYELFDQYEAYFEAEDGEISWVAYNCTPDVITVQTNDGDSFSGSVREVLQKLYSKYGCWFTYSRTSGEAYEKEFEVGKTYGATFSMGGQTTDYQVTIRERSSKPLEVNKEEQVSKSNRRFSFTPEAGGLYRIEMSGSEGSSPLVKFYEDGREENTFGDDGIYESFTLWLKKGKTYYFKCDDYGLNPMAYTLLLTKETKDIAVLKFDQNAVSMVKGQEMQLAVAMDPSDAANKTLRWSSSNEDAVRVNQEGKLTALKEGRAIITAIATDGTAVSATCEVTVTDKSVEIKAESLTLDQTSATLTAGESMTLQAKILPSDTTNQKIVWKSSDEKTATVDDSGKVTAVKAGEAIVTATTADGAQSASCKIVVKAKEVKDEVKKVAVKGLKLNKTSEELAANSVLQLKVTFTPSNPTEKGLIWKSSNPAVASVDKNGKVTAKKYGKPVTITVTSKADSTIKAACKIQTRLSDATKKNVDAEMFKAIYWAVDHDISGMFVRFNTKSSMTRGQFVRFLWNMAGKPKINVKKIKNPFADVNSKTAHYKQILWAVDQGLIGGTKLKNGKQVFKPTGTLTRQNVATILWKYAGCPKVSKAKKPFADVAKSEAVAWGKSKGIFKADKNGKFNPKSDCIRGDFAVFLYRYNKKYKVVK